MLNPANLIRNRQRRSVTARSQRFIKNQDEPRDHPSHDSLPNDETVLVENSPSMRRRFRLIAQRIRIISIYGINKKTRNNKE